MLLSSCQITRGDKHDLDNILHNIMRNEHTLILSQKGVQRIPQHSSQGGEILTWQTLEKVHSDTQVF